MFCGKGSKKGKKNRCEPKLTVRNDGNLEKEGRNWRDHQLEIIAGKAPWGARGGGEGRKVIENLRLC